MKGRVLKPDIPHAEADFIGYLVPVKEPNLPQPPVVLDEVGERETVSHFISLIVKTVSHFS